MHRNVLYEYVVSSPLYCVDSYRHWFLTLPLTGIMEGLSSGLRVSFIENTSQFLLMITCGVPCVHPGNKEVMLNRTSPRESSQGRKGRLKLNYYFF